MIKTIFAHLKTIICHKHYVRQYCWKAKLFWQGLVHDLSKFSPTEFFESVKYFQGYRSPIEACKEKNGYSNAWFHHRGRNKHHYEYWCDNFDNGTTCVEMPYKYAVEMLCDFLGAGRAYFGDKFTYKAEYEWWVNKKKPIAKMGKYTKMYIDKCLHKLSELEDKQLSINTKSNRKSAIDEFWDFKLYEQYWVESTELYLEEKTKAIFNAGPKESKPKTKYYKSKKSIQKEQTSADVVQTEVVQKEPKTKKKPKTTKQLDLGDIVVGETNTEEDVEKIQ